MAEGFPFANTLRTLGFSFLLSVCGSGNNVFNVCPQWETHSSVRTWHRASLLSTAWLTPGTVHEPVTAASRGCDEGRVDREEEENEGRGREEQRGRLSTGIFQGTGKGIEN